MSHFTSVQIEAAVTQLNTDIGLWHDIVQGDALTSVTTESGPVPSILNFYDQVLTAIAAGSFPGVLFANHNDISTGYAVTSADQGKTINLTAGNITVTVGAATGFPSTFSCLIVNRTSNRCQFVEISGYTPTRLRLWPGFSVWLQRNSSDWVVMRTRGRWNSRDAGGFLYCDFAAGNELNDGMSAAAPLKYIQTAVNLDYLELDTPLTIQLAPGTYLPQSGTTVCQIVGQPVGHHLITIQGDTTGTGQASYRLQCPAGGTAFDVQDQGIGILVGCTVESSGNGSTLVSARQEAIVDLFGVDMGVAQLGTHISCTTQSSIGILNNGGNPTCMRVLGHASTHVACTVAGYVNYGSFNVEIPVALGMTIWLAASDGGVISNGGVPMTYSGAGYAGTTGQKWAATYNGIIHSGNPNEPGDVAGAASFGGLYT